MFVKGVGRKGKKVNVADDFSIHVPYGWCYAVDEYAPEDEPVFRLLHPESRPSEYGEAGFYFDGLELCEVVLNFRQKVIVTVAEDDTEIDVDIEDILKKLSNILEDITLRTALGAFLDFGDDDKDEDDIRRMYKVVKDDPFLKVGYFTCSVFGRTVYNVVLVTSHYVYVSYAIVFLEGDYKDNEETLENILSSIEPLNVKVYKESEEQKDFVQQTYLNKVKAKVGPLTIVLPDGFEYITEDHVPQNDSKAKSVLDNYTMIAAPADCKGGLRNFDEASFGISVSEPKQVGLVDEAWKDICAIKQQINSNDQGLKFKFVKEGANFLIGYCKGGESKAGDELYWVSYIVLIFCGSLQYTSNLFFNSKKASVSEYTKAVETFCSKISVNAEDIEETEVNLLRKDLGDMLDDNGRLNGIVVSQLYANDVIFNNDDEVTYDGTHTIITGFQFNATVIDDYPGIVKNANTFAKELKRVVSFVEQNENLMIPKSKFHPNILEATKDNPITGATLFEFCAWHMLLIAEADKNKYTVAIDRNLIKGIPDAFTFVGEFIRTLRAYNEIYDDFEVTYASALNADGPCGNISSPVRGAITDSAKTIKVKGGYKEDFDGYTAKLKEIDSVSDEDYEKDELSRLEKKVNADVIAALKADAKHAKAVFAKVSAAIKAKNYNRLRNIDSVIRRICEAVDESTRYIVDSLSYTHRPFLDSYEMEYEAQSVVTDVGNFGYIQMTLAERTSTIDKFDPNEFPKRLCAQIDDLTEDYIYRQLLESANFFIERGSKVFAKLSATYIRRMLKEMGNDFEVRGTQYEGRIERIEKVKVGNKLTLKREPDSKYGSNTIVLETSFGSVGILPYYITRLLSPALDGGTITAVAEVIKVEPLSQRSSTAKRPLLNVKISVKSKNTHDSVKGKTKKVSKINQDEKKRLEEEAKIAK